MNKLFLIVSLLLVSLFGDARPVLPDSLLTVRKSYVYHITSPDTTQAILAALREKKMAPEWRLDMAEGDFYYNMRRYRMALKYYQRVDGCPEISDSTQVQMLLLKRMMDCYDELLENANLVETIFRLRKLAKDNDNKAFEAMTLFTSGKWHHLNGQKARGYQFCEEALQMMKDSDYPSKHVELRSFYGELLKMYARDNRFDEAMRMSQLQEAEAQQAESGRIQKARERGLRQVYALRASMLAKAGRMSEADKAYNAWKQISGGNAIDDREIYDYLVLSHHYEEALSVITRYHDFLYTHGDTISMRMLSVVNKEALLRVDMHNYEKASELGHRIEVLIDSIHKRRSSEQMQTTYELLQEQFELHEKSKWLSYMTIILVAILLMVLLALYFLRVMHRRNRQLVQVLNGLDAYRRAVINGDAPTSPEAVAALETVRSLQVPDNVPKGGEGEPDDEDRRLYVEMDKQVTRDRLFLRPGLGREDLMRLVGVDKNRFGKMMSKYSDASNTSVYINMKRVEYGAKLLLEHPEYTIATVATESGMSNTVTFNRVFKETYNMRPSEYREMMTDIMKSKP